MTPKRANRKNDREEDQEGEKGVEGPLEDGRGFQRVAAQEKDEA